MKRFLIRRILLFLPVLLGTLTVVFSIIHFIPGDPVDIMLGENAMPADKEALRKALRLDLPIHKQYLVFLSDLIKGNLGYSIYTKQPVIKTILERYPATIELALASTIVSVVLSFPMGIIAALYKDRWPDHISRFLSLVGLCMPNFFLAPALIIIFSIKLGLLPVSGRGGIENIILPSITLGLGMSSILTRMIRSSLCEVLSDDYIRAAKAKGIDNLFILIKHAIPNALIPVITIIAMQFGSLLAGSIITETIFSWPGIGRLVIQSIYARDYPLLQGCLIFISLSYQLINLILDLMYAFLDPRIRYEKGIF